VLWIDWGGWEIPLYDSCRDLAKTEKKDLPEGKQLGLKAATLLTNAMLLASIKKTRLNYQAGNEIHKYLKKTKISKKLGTW